MEELVYHGLPNWIMAAASVLAAGTVVFAYRSYRDQKERERIALAKQVRTTWVKNSEGAWGVLVDNSTGDDINDLVLDVQGKGSSQGDAEPKTTLTRSNLGSGAYVWVSQHRYDHRWEHPVRVRDSYEWEEIPTGRLRICSIRYRQNGKVYSKDLDNDSFTVSDA